MSFFHKDFHKRLVQHISELDHFGLLPVDWIWHKDKVRTLEKLSKELLEDLINLHNTHQEIGDTIPHIIPLIKELHVDLEHMLEEHKLTKDTITEEATLANQLIEHLRDVLKKQVYGMFDEDTIPVTFLTPKEIEYCKSLVRGDEYQKMGRYVKQKWNKRVDRAFIQSVKTIHWGDVDNIKYAITALNRRSELPCNGYLKPPYICGWLGGLGLMINGHVTLAGFADLQSNEIQGGSEEEIQRYTPLPEYLIVNRKTFISPVRKGSYNEFIVDNWKPEALVLDEKKLEKYDFEKHLGKDPRKEEIIIFLKEFARKHNLPLMDTLGRRV